MALSMFERRRLAEIEDHFHVEDPRLARMMVEWSLESARGHRRHLLELLAAAVACVAALVSTALLGGGVGAGLLALGAVGLVIVIVVVAEMFPAHHMSKTGPGISGLGDRRGWPPPADDRYLWFALWAGWR